jgi:spore germination protein KA
MACGMKSFGVPFFVPVAPKTNANPDVIVRHPIWTQKTRPDSNQNANRQRQGNNVKNWCQDCS